MRRKLWPGDVWGKAGKFSEVPAYTVLTGRETGVVSVGYRILYFYKKENTFYRDGRGTNLFMEEREPDASVRVYFCGLPEYYERQTKWIGRRKRRGIFRVGKDSMTPEYSGIPWNFNQLLRLMQNCCEYVSADACYLEEQFERELAEEEFGCGSGGQRMCGELIGKIPGSFRGIDGILYRSGGDGERTGELPLPDGLLRKLRYFFYLGEKSELYTALEENLWQEYGMPLLSVKNMAESAAYQVSRLLVIDDRPEGAADREALPEGSVYLDLWSNPGRRAQITENRTNIKYISEYLWVLGNK